MTRRKSIFAVLLLAVFAVVALVGCEKGKLFKLTLDEGVSIVTEGIDFNKVAKDHEITVKVTIPEGKELESFKVNGEDKLAELQEFKYTFKVVQDTEVKVTFKDKAVVEETFELVLPDEVKVKTPAGLDVTKVKKDTKVVLKVTPPAGKVVNEFKVNGEVKQLTEALEFTLVVTKKVDVTVTFKDEVPPVKTFKLSLTQAISVKAPLGLNTDEVPEGTEVTLLVTVPTGQEVKSFKVNEEEVQLAENLEHTLTITANTNVSVELEAIKVKATVAEDSVAHVAFVGEYVEGKEVDYGTEVSFKLKDIPAGKEVDKVMAGEVELTAVEGVYSHKLVADVVIEVVLKAIQVKATVAEDSVALVAFEGGYVAEKEVDYDTTVSFKLNEIPAGKELDKVMAGEVELTAVEGVYSHKLVADVVIEVVLKATKVKATVAPDSVAHVAFVGEYVAEKEVDYGTEVSFKLKDIPAGKEVDKVMAGDAVLDVDPTGVYSHVLTADVEIQVVLKTIQVKATVHPGSLTYVKFEGEYESGQEVDLNTVVKFKVTDLPPEKEIVKVTADDETLEADAEGFYSITLTEDVEILVDLTTIRVTLNIINLFDEWLLIDDDFATYADADEIDMMKSLKIYLPYYIDSGNFITDIKVNGESIPDISYKLYSKNVQPSVRKSESNPDGVEVYDEEFVEIQVNTREFTIEIVTADLTTLEEKLSGFSVQDVIVNGAPDYYDRFLHDKSNIEAAQYWEQYVEQWFQENRDIEVIANIRGNEGGSISGGGAHVASVDYRWFLVDYSYPIGLVSVKSDPRKYNQYKVDVDLGGANINGSTENVEVLFDTNPAQDYHATLTIDSLKEKLEGLTYEGHTLRRLVYQETEEQVVLYNDQFRENLKVKLVFEETGSEKWFVNFFRYNSWGDPEILKTEEVLDGQTVTPYELPAPANHGFKHWFIDDENTPFDFESEIHSDLMLQPKFERNRAAYVINFAEVEEGKYPLVDSYDNPFKQFIVYPGESIPNIKPGNYGYYPQLLKGKSILGFKIKLPGADKFVEWNDGLKVPEGELSDDIVIEHEVVLLDHDEGYNIGVASDGTYYIARIYKPEGSDSVTVKHSHIHPELGEIKITDVRGYRSILRTDNELLTNLTFEEGFINFDRISIGFGKVTNLKLPSTIEKYNNNLIQEGNVDNVSFSNEDNITELPKRMFANTGIKSIKIPENLKEIPQEFLYHTNIESLVIPDNVTKIGRRAIYSEVMTNLQLPSGLITIEAESLGAFLVENLEIPASATDISSFYSYSIPDENGVRHLPKYVTNAMADNEGFYIVNGLLMYFNVDFVLSGTVLEFPDKVKVINLSGDVLEKAMISNRTITKFIIPGTVEKVIALPNTRNLKDIEIKEGVQFLDKVGVNAKFLETITDVSTFTNEPYVTPNFLHGSKIANQAVAETGLFFYAGQLIQLGQIVKDNTETLIIPEGVKYMTGPYMLNDWGGVFQPHEFNYKKLVLPESLISFGHTVAGIQLNRFGAKNTLEEIVFKGDKIQNFGPGIDSSKLVTITFEKLTYAQIETMINNNFDKTKTGFSPHFMNIGSEFATVIDKELVEKVYTTTFEGHDNLEIIQPPEDGNYYMGRVYLVKIINFTATTQFWVNIYVTTTLEDGTEVEEKFAAFKNMDYDNAYVSKEFRFNYFGTRTIEIRDR